MARENMENQPSIDKPAYISVFAHENAMMHIKEECRNAITNKDKDNKRMMIICIILCITLIIVVVTLVAYYTSRTAIWKDLTTYLADKLVEVTNAQCITPP